MDRPSHHLGSSQSRGDQIMPGHQPSESPRPPPYSSRTNSQTAHDRGPVRFSNDRSRSNMTDPDPEAPHRGPLSPSELYTIPSRGDMEYRQARNNEPSSSRQRRRSEASESLKSPVPISSSQTTDAEAPVYRPKPQKRRKLESAGGAFKAGCKNVYQKYIIEGLLRQKPLPPSPNGRHVRLDAGRKRSDLVNDERTGKPHINNFIRSSRYTIWDFLPKQILFQFSKLANFYFLVIGIMQMIPGLSTTGTWTTIAPLIAFVAFSIAKEGYDDYRRYKLDKIENRSEVWVLGAKSKTFGRRSKKEKAGRDADLEDADVGVSDGEWTKVQWQKLRVGDIIRLRRDENVPADIVLLHATGPNSVAYIETMALDGETNLKSKQACPPLAQQCDTMAGLKACDALVVSEDPNVDLYNYHGRVTVKEETSPLTLNNVVYRGSTVRNTTESIGLIINTGEECKIRMNAHKHVRTKAPAMQYVVNRIIVFLVFVVVAISLGLTAGYYIWREPTERLSWYLMGSSVSFKEILIAYIIMFNTLIPLSLYVSLEIIKIGQFILMMDVEMYDPVSNTPMVANTTTILENLGQVTHVFSDKTGTLTENLMRFRKISVAGTAWLHDMDIEKDEETRQKRILAATHTRKGKNKQGLTQGRKSSTHDVDDPDADGYARREKAPPGRTNSTASASQLKAGGQPAQGEGELKTEDLLEYIRRKPNTTFSRKTKHFLLCIALCHTCLPEIKDNGDIEYQAASPDELALVEAARDLGYLLIDRPAQSIKLQLPDGNGSVVTETYQILDVIEFTSKRKRMSIILRMPDGRICVFCKGADSAIMPRLKLANLALQKAQSINRTASVRRSMERERAVKRMSVASMGSPRNSTTIRRSSTSGNRLSQNLRRNSSHRVSTELNKRSNADDIQTWIKRRETEELPSPITGGDAYHSPRHSVAASHMEDYFDGLVDESIAANEGMVFERCFQHIDDFASEGLRTLLYAYRYLEDSEYEKWNTIYHDATTSLENRQEKIEAAGELIEEKFDLAGATAIEDKLQNGVPDTIDKLRRANIKVWMLTGDKRETAINIGHSARLCKPFSDIFVLDSTVGNLQDSLTAALGEVGRGTLPHTVVVVDGQTLTDIEENEDLKFLFFDLVIRVDSVICCRASPSQKANLVKAIRNRVPKSMTLAIGDGANDIGMIQASHVGIGISGREGLQAARTSDYSIAQFRFLQRLLFVHGRWNYIRTGKYVLATFWKEIVFFIVQAHYQRLNGYTGTSLYENWSLTVFNTLFTSLPVIILGIFEQDLRPETLLALPELYVFGQKNMGFNVFQYIGWTLMGVIESFGIFYITWGVYNELTFDQDNDLFAYGMSSFTVTVLFINTKLLLLEMHHKTIITFGAFIISTGGWFLWNILISATYREEKSIYVVRNAFLHNFGHTLNWWTTILVAFASVVVLELVVNAVRRVYWPHDQDLMQRIEKDRGAKGVLREHAAERGEHSAAGDRKSFGGQGGMGGDGVSEVNSIHQGESKPRSSMHRFGWGRSRHEPRQSISSQTGFARQTASPVGEDGDRPYGTNMKRSRRPMSVGTKWLGNNNDEFIVSPIEMQSPTEARRFGER